MAGKRPEIKLGGKAYKLGALSLNVLARLQEKWGCKLSEAFGLLQGKLETEEAATLRFFISCVLLDEYPEMTEEKVGGLITINNMADAVQAVTAVLGE